MIRKSLLLNAFLCCIGLFSHSAQAGLQPDELALQNMQVYACQSVSSLLLYRGEGFQEDHAARMNSDLAALESAVNAYPKADADLRQSYQKLTSLVRSGAAFGRGDDDVPWRYSKDLAHGLLGFLDQVERRVPPTDEKDGVPLWQLPARIEFVTVLYLGRSYIGNLEIAREKPQEYFGQDESVLVPQLDQGIDRAMSDPKDPDATKKMQSRWDYLKSALTDFDSKSNSPVTLSGRPWAPIIVDRNARALSAQLMQISQAQ